MISSVPKNCTGIPTMARKKAASNLHCQYHKDGSLWARGPLIEGVMEGAWEFFRKDGTKLRSGSFLNGEQVGEWTTYDKQGQVYKVTKIKPKKTT